MQIAEGLDDTAEAFLASIDSNESEIAPSSIYAAACILEGVPFINGSPQNTFVPGLIELAVQKGKLCPFQTPLPVSNCCIMIYNWLKLLHMVPVGHWSDCIDALTIYYFILGPQFERKVSPWHPLRSRWTHHISWEAAALIASGCHLMSLCNIMQMCS